MNPINAYSPLVQWMQKGAASYGVRAIYNFYRSDYAKALQLGGSGCLGAKKLYVDGISEYNDCQSIGGDTSEQRFRLTQAQHHIAYGISSVGAGICGVMAALRLAFMKSTPLYWLLMGNTLFALANVVSFCCNVRKYHHVKQLPHNEKQEQHHRRSIQRSAILGAISSFAYVAMEVLSMAGAPSLVTLAAGIIGSAVTCVHWMMDFLTLMQTKRQTASLLKPNVVVPPKSHDPMRDAGLASQDQRLIENQIRYVQLTASKV